MDRQTQARDPQAHRRPRLHAGEPSKLGAMFQHPGRLDGITRTECVLSATLPIAPDGSIHVVACAWAIRRARENQATDLKEKQFPDNVE